MSLRLLVACVAMIGATAASGCGSDRDATAPVSGRVTVDGEPVVGAQVRFQAGRRTAAAQTGEDGRFTLSTYEKDDGAVPGTHTVAVLFPRPIFVGTLRPGEMPPKPVADDWVSPVPQKYWSEETSGLTREVVEGEDNFFEIELSRD